MEITLPNQWQPRHYQRRLWSYLESGGKRAVAVWHRRAGKDEVCLHWAACAAMQRVGNYWHMLPEASQARKAIWDAINPHTGKRRIDEAFPPSIRVGQRDDDMRIKLVNGSSWQIVGSDNFNSLVGSSRRRGCARQPIHAVWWRWTGNDDGPVGKSHAGARSTEVSGFIVRGERGCTPVVFRIQPGIHARERSPNACRTERSSLSTISSSSGGLAL
jgi:hypothetical protein